MKTFLAILGGIFLVLLVVSAILVGYFFTVGPKFDTSSKAYVDQLVRGISLTWSTEALIDRGCSEFRKSVSEDQVQTLFTKLVALGKLTEYEGATGEAHINITTAGVNVSASYQVETHFEHSDAKFSVSLHQASNQWCVSGFHVDSPVLSR